MRKLRTILLYKYTFKFLFIISVIFCILFNCFIKFESKYNISDTKFILKIKQIDIYDKQISIFALGKEKIKLTYYYDDIKEVDNLKIGDLILVTGELELPNKASIFNNFDYRRYLYYNKIYYIIRASSIVKIKNNTSLIYKIKDDINNRLSNYNTASYLETFILGNTNNIDDDILNIYYDLGISHLFSISGMHISLIAFFLLFFLNRVSYNRFFNYFIFIIFLIFYSILIDFPASVFRSLVMYILFSINILFNFKIKSIDIALFTFVVCIFINPLIIHDIGFQFSYINVFSLILLKDKIKDTNMKSLYTCYICFMVSLPICIYNFYEVNFIGIVLNVIVIPLVNVVIFPLCILTFIIPIFDNILLFFINILENICLLVNKIEFSKIILCKPNVFVFIIYYIIIYTSFYNKKYIFVFIVLILVHKNINYFNNFLNVSYLDVGQGDSIFIAFPHNKANILIDTGGNINSSYNIASNNIIPYLKSIGVNRIDYLIISHGDFDHIGEAINLVENFKVEKVIFNCGKFNELEQELIKVLDKKTIPYYSCIKELNIDDNKLYFLNNKDYGNENDNSSVIYTELNNHKFLFMGDAGVEVEEDLIENYNLQNIDVLKVGHHGSKTSSSKEFINEINPNYSIISVGKNNRYGHPNDSVLQNLNDSKIYRTDQDGSIMFKIKNNKLEIETCAP